MRQFVLDTEVYKIIFKNKQTHYKAQGSLHKTRDGILIRLNRLIWEGIMDEA